VEDILGLLPLKAVEKSRWDAVMSLIITLRRKARAEKNYALADFIRDELAKAGIRLLDFPHETLWELEA
jgi:cysteinyl-tRNA synthetase